MIDRMEWHPEKRIGELLSPFTRGAGERPLRITFYSDSLVNVSGESLEALRLLRELRHLSGQIEVVETDHANPRYLEIGKFNLEDEFIPIRVVRGEQEELSTGVWYPKQWLSVSAHTVGRAADDPETKAMFQELVLGMAHIAIRGDILVTTSPLLLRHRDKKWVSETNPRTPLEAAHIVGLFLRSRSNYAYRAADNYKETFDRGLFYWVLTRFRLPTMWRYLAACVLAGQARGDDTMELAQSVVKRAARALEARDAIGIQFYSPQDNNTRDQMMYHFDYLTLLLAGAIDAEARIANRAYEAVPNELFVRLRGEAGQRLLKGLREKKAERLCEVLGAEKVKDVLELVYAPRNTIHGSALNPFGYAYRAEPEHSYALLSEPLGDKIWTCAERLGGAATWGLWRPIKDIWLEPYSYATELVRVSFDIINELAAATDVVLLLPDQPTTLCVPDKPPEGKPFCWGSRLALLA